MIQHAQVFSLQEQLQMAETEAEPCGNKIQDKSQKTGNGHCFSRESQLFDQYKKILHSIFAYYIRHTIFILLINALINAQPLFIFAINYNAFIIICSARNVCGSVYGLLNYSRIIRDKPQEISYKREVARDKGDYYARYTERTVGNC